MLLLSVFCLGEVVELEPFRPTLAGFPTLKSPTSDALVIVAAAAAVIVVFERLPGIGTPEISFYNNGVPILPRENKSLFVTNCYTAGCGKRHGRIEDAAVHRFGIVRNRIAALVGLPP